jgi:hypothetical protein
MPDGLNQAAMATDAYLARLDDERGFVCSLSSMDVA